MLKSLLARLLLKVEAVSSKEIPVLFSKLSISLLTLSSSLLGIYMFSIYFLSSDLDITLVAIYLCSTLFKTHFLKYMVEMKLSRVDPSVVMQTCNA